MKADKERLEFLKKDAVQGFTRMIGLTPVSLKPGEFITRIKLEEHLCQQDGFVHAGVISTMADHSAGYACYSLVPESHRILTVEFKISFFKPASGDYLECKAWVSKPGRQILFTEAEIYSVKDGNKVLIARAMHTMASVPREKVAK
ncbi:MAG: PaaI family thioesterase [Dehalococcoidia bacterium]|nr:PaaI family thioesterase [Dehalococcoidia bacterium]